jgi:hypothetical protein
MNSLVSPEKPKALHKGSQIAAIAPASPAKEERITSGRRHWSASDSPSRHSVRCIPKATSPDRPKIAAQNSLLH